MHKNKKDRDCLFVVIKKLEKRLFMLPHGADGGTGEGGGPGGHQVLLAPGKLTLHLKNTFKKSTILVQIFAVYATRKKTRENDRR